MKPKYHEKIHTKREKYIAKEYASYGKSKRNCTGASAGDGMYYIGSISYIIEAVGQKYFIGRASCSTDDVFDKKLGRDLAKKRAERALIRWLYNRSDPQKPTNFGLRGLLHAESFGLLRGSCIFEYDIHLR